MNLRSALAFACVVQFLPVAARAAQELEVFLFVQKPVAAGNQRAVRVIWIPPPLEKYCVGKTTEECTTLDYCIRTTNPDVPMCRGLKMDLKRLAYPPEVRPRRLMSITYFPVAGLPGLDTLFQYFETAPKEAMERLSGKARIKAKIKFVRKPDDDKFDLLEVLAVPPL